MIKGIAPVLTLGGNRVQMPEDLPKYKIRRNKKLKGELALFTGYGKTEGDAEFNLCGEISRHMNHRGYNEISTEDIRFDKVGGLVEASCVSFLIEKSSDAYSILERRRPEEIYEKMMAGGHIRVRG